jgi:hypothetical protein
MPSELSRHYQALSPRERFVLLVQAMARPDEREADRLQDTCPLFTYRAEDAEFRDRMKRAYMITATVCLNMREGLAQLRMARAFREMSEQFSGPVLRLATAALLWGRAYGHWEAGAVAEVGVPEPEALATELRANPYLKEQLGELRDGVGEAMAMVAGEVLDATGEAHAGELLAQWEGFNRFCREELGLEPGAVTAAFGLGGDDPAAEVRATCPDAVAEEAEVARAAEQWTRTWRRRFPAARAAGCPR